jgi:toxin ParE1/3/4
VDEGCFIEALCRSAPPRIDAPRLAEDLARIAEHLLAHEVSSIGERLAAVLHALDVLERHPLIGRKVQHNRRELVTGRDSRGYVALYRFDELDDVIEVLALRAQREAGLEDA